MAIKPGHREHQVGPCGSWVSARSGRTRPRPARRLQPARRQLSARTSQSGTQTASACSTRCAPKTSSESPMQATARRSTARLQSSPWMGSSARSSHAAPRSRRAPIELDLSSDRNLRPDPMEFSAHSVHGPALPRPRRSPPHGLRTVRREPSPPPSLPGKLPSRALLSGAGTHASADAQRLALADSDLRTHVANAQAL